MKIYIKYAEAEGADYKATEEIANWHTVLRTPFNISGFKILPMIHRIHGASSVMLVRSGPLTDALSHTLMSWTGNDRTPL